MVRGLSRRERIALGLMSILFVLLAIILLMSSN